VPSCRKKTQKFFSGCSGLVAVKRITSAAPHWSVITPFLLPYSCAPLYGACWAVGRPAILGSLFLQLESRLLLHSVTDSAFITLPRSEEERAIGTRTPMTLPRALQRPLVARLRSDRRFRTLVRSHDRRLHAKWLAREADTSFRRPGERFAPASCSFNTAIICSSALPRTLLATSVCPSRPNSNSIWGKYAGAGHHRLMRK
jgi:hypothetical protein